MSEAIGGFSNDDSRFLINVFQFRVVPAVRTTARKMHSDPAYLRYAAMKDELKVQLVSMINVSGGSPFPKGTPLTVRMTIGKIKTGKFAVGLCDIDNLAKSVLDCMNGIVFADDRDVVELHVRKLGVERDDQEYLMLQVDGGQS